MNKTFPKPITIGLLVWLVAAVGVGGAGLLAHARPPQPQLLILGLSLGTLALCRLVPLLRQWVTTADLNYFVAFHLTRFVGAYFLFLGKRGELPMAFAEPAGWGDLVVAFIAVIILTQRPAFTGDGRKIFLMWNILGAVDIVLVVVKAAQLGLADPESMKALTSLPLSLLPTFVVPIIIVTHVLIFVRWWQTRPQGQCAR